MNKSSKKLSVRPAEIRTGLFSKEEAAQGIISGIQHIHSSSLGSADPCWKVTEARLKGVFANYPWEIADNTNGLILVESGRRNDCFETLCLATQFGQKSQNRERLKIVLEELLSNAFYHSFKNNNKEDKYDRRTSVKLAAGEEIQVFFKENSSGLHLVVQDQGGTLGFNNFISCFRRCFQQTPTHIAFDERHTGAGLGLFLLFESVSHMSISVRPGKKTRISVWISNSNQYDPDSYSFNFFEE